MNPEWLKPSDGYGWRAVIRNVLPLFALLWVAQFLAGKNALAPWGLAPVIGLYLYRITIVMHDCTHHTLFESRRLNRMIGSLMGVISGVDFNSFCQQHWRHHQSYGRAGDPQGFQYLELRSMTPGELRWHLAKPLFGLSMRNVVAESLLAPRNLARLLRTGELAIVALVQLVILTIVTRVGTYPVLAALPFLSGATFGLFFSQLRGIAEHSAPAGSDTYVVRSHEPSRLDRIFLYDVNFNYHAEHHAHPQIPSCHLPAFHRAERIPLASGKMFDTLRTVLHGSPSPHV
jgi:fatty acid desaturase